MRHISTDVARMSMICFDPLDVLKDNVNAAYVQGGHGCVTFDLRFLELLLILSI